MVLNVASRRTPRIPPALALLLWCALATVLVQLLLAREASNPRGFSPIFWYLLSAYDAHGNLLLLAIAVAAFLLRRHPAAIALVRVAGDHPWRIAAAALLLSCAGALTVYRSYPLSMDEYVAVFQAQAFAGGSLSGRFPPELLDRLLPRFPEGYFFIASRATGEVSGSYWPGFALLVAPFAWLGIPWAANPVISALTLPALHRLTLSISGSREAAGWAVLLTLASPVFIVSALSYYSMPAHLLCNLLYALLLLQPTAGRALLAGLVGGLALTLHNPAPHLLFSVAIIVWLLVRRTPLPVFAALLAGYLPVVALLGYGWSQHLQQLSALAAAPASAGALPGAAPAAPPSALSRFAAIVSSALVFPTPKILEARLAGLSKAWDWGAAGLMVFAAYGYAAARALSEVKLLAAALALTFFGYFLVPLDQGHGWGYRYLHPAWFVLPVFAGFALSRLQDAEFRNMAGWAVVLSLVLANGLRLAQVDGFIGRHLSLVPPLARPSDPAKAEILFIDPAAGSYTRDMVHNDPFLREPRMTMVYDGPQKTAALMAQRFPAYTRSAQGKWGELWTK
jgi:hypothetical protein